MEGDPIRAGRYLLHGVIGAGGTSTVHFGMLEGAGGFSRVVAIKRLYPHFAKNPEFVERFLDEARLVTRIHHPNVVSTLDVVVDGGECLVVMEYVPGETLSRLLQVSSRSETPPSPSIIVAVACDMLRGLQAAHQAKDEKGAPLGIVHRDVSPQNVLVGSDGFSRILDFGIATVIGQTSMTPHDRMRGKISYMAPEQQRGERATRQSDVFSAAVVLWEALVGRRLFLDDSDAKTRENVLSLDVEPPSAFSPAVSSALDAVVMRALERDPLRRYSSAKEMLGNLEQALEPATPREVGLWVDSLAHDALVQRSDVARAVEGICVEDAPERTAAAVVPQLLAARAAKSTNAEQPTQDRPPSRAPFFVAAGAAVSSLVALKIAIHATTKEQTTAGEMAEPEPIASLPPTTLPSSSDNAPQPAASDSTGLHVREPHARPHGPAAHSHCNPPFVYDGSGHKVYKPECF